MKKLIVLILTLLLCGVVYAADRVSLQSGSGAELGTASNPIIVSVTEYESEVTIGGTEEKISGTNSYVDFNDEGAGTVTLGGKDGTNNETLEMDFETGGIVTFTPSSTFVVNGADIIFDTTVNGMFYDDSTDRVGIGTSAPTTALEVTGEVTVTDTNTGGNAGSDLCLGANNTICVCGTCN